MNRIINRLKLVFLTVFGVLTIGVGVYQFGWAIPAKKCEEKQDWWDWRTRTCAHPIPISDITGRIIDTPEARAEAKARIAAIKAQKAAATAEK
jgi:hypothetical protein